MKKTKLPSITLTILKYIEWLWLFLISYLTVNKYAPIALNADVLLNSLMSLRNITLFYWGQNRLLNVLPFLVSPIRNPSLNLSAILFITSLSTFLLLFLISRFTVRTIDNEVEKNNTLATQIFIALSGLFILGLNGGGVSEITINHIEWTLPFLLSGTAIYILWFEKLKKISHNILSVILIFIATGVNPTILIMNTFIAGASTLYNKRNYKKDLLIFLISFISFAIWAYISTRLGPINSYANFSIKHISENIISSGASIFNTFNLSFVLLVLIMFTTVEIYRILNKGQNHHYDNRLQQFCSAAVLLFSLCWIILFAGNKWVSMNLISIRYFIPVFFCIFIGISFKLSFILSEMKERLSSLIVCILLLMSFANLYTRFSNYQDFQLFKEINTLSPYRYKLYAGDYWSVWPLVLRDQMEGITSFGLAYRSEGDQYATKEFIENELKKSGLITVLCVKSSLENCINQTERSITLATVKTNNQENNKAFEIKFAIK